MDQELRTQLAHLKLPTMEAEIEAFNQLMKQLELPARFGTPWEEFKSHIQSYHQHAWFGFLRGRRDALTSQDGIFTTWSFGSSGGLERIEILDIDIVRNLQLDEDDEDEGDDQYDDEEEEDDGGDIADNEPPYGTFFEFARFVSHPHDPFEFISDTAKA